MAYSPIAHVAVNYRDYANNWIKAYSVGTTTPKAMALESNGGTHVAKLEINVDGFIVSAGGALVIPYINDNYDLWLFPTEAEADANDTSNALRIADGSQGETGSSLIEPRTLTDGQTTVVLTEVDTASASFYITGDNVDRGRLYEGATNDYTITSSSTIELNSSFPAESILLALGYAEIDAGTIAKVFGRVGLVTAQNGDYNASQITTTPVGNLSSVEQQATNAEIDTRTSKVLPQTVTGTLTVGGRINQIRDSGSFTLPLASGVDADTILVVELPDKYKAQTPVITRAGSDTITNSTGTDTSITFAGAAKLTLTSDGVSDWSL